MLFSSVSFIYCFLPVFLAAYFVVPARLKNGVLLLFSLIFYFAGEPVYIWILLLSSVSDYLHGRFIGSRPGTPAARAALVSSIAVNIGLLSFFKYSDFFINTVNSLTGSGLEPLGLALPLGISFYTFQTMSYTIDVYRGEVPAQKSLSDFAAYVTMFPQLVAGPIVRYRTVAEELEYRKASFGGFALGVRRFTVGLSKKVLLANALGQLAEAAAEGTAGEPSVLLYWLGALGFMMQIYFDFSGYSDMAIGLGAMMGFTFPENFRYPFTARSVTEFWKRWHMTLGGWFRDYVYIPMGGNRKGRLRWIFNVFVVWFLTGFWHGAGWNFILWGLYFAVLLCLEKFVFRIFLGKWAVTDRIYTLLVLVVSFVIFDSVDVAQIPVRIKGMLGIGSTLTGNPAAVLPLWNDYGVYYLKSYAVLLAVSVFASTPALALICGKLDRLARGGSEDGTEGTAAGRIVGGPEDTMELKGKEDTKLQTKTGRKSRAAQVLLAVGEPVVLTALLLLCTAYIVDSSFNPFLYFRF
ncbi:MBOAT family O-acyltransferase [Bacilliculturomica massiliensis]|uniref:MBOAT family O-acyltransferase n=1 Tax=Bacilliculturomica massiliensis TaxID=1917867 RepID=UPI0010319B3A|nr:MBOAT family O-acyltransferase [Bacilliculturomica massiliensis]